MAKIKAAARPRWLWIGSIALLLVGFLLYRSAIAEETKVKARPGPVSESSSVSSTEFDSVGINSLSTTDGQTTLVVNTIKPPNGFTFVAFPSGNWANVQDVSNTFPFGTAFGSTTTIDVAAWSSANTISAFDLRMEGNLKQENAKNGKSGKGGQSKFHWAARTTSGEFTVYVVRPYTYTKVFGVEHRTVFAPDFTTPRTAFKTSLEGFQKGDPEPSASTPVEDIGKTWHGGDASVGHTFMHLVYTAEDGSVVDKWYAQTGGPVKVSEQKADYEAIKDGTYYWHTEPGKPSPEVQLMNWAKNANVLETGGGATTPLVVHHTWKLKLGSTTGSELKKRLDKHNIITNPTGHNYTRFGLDIDTTGGGCSALAGEVMHAVGFTEQGGWQFNEFAPIVGVDLKDDLSIDAFMKNPLTDAWPTALAPTNRPLRFFDTAKIAEWMVNNPGDSTAP